MIMPPDNANLNRFLNTPVAFEIKSARMVYYVLMN
jgi:hypothetical protein